MRTLLVLARISNVPTVWSNCFAATLLAGGTSGSRLAILCLGATLLYTGGMFLNDAVDQAFDRCYRPERPIVSGKISARAVWALSVLLLTSGWVVFLCLGRDAAVAGSALVAAIVWYDLVHKRTRLAPLLMAACRFILYLLAAAVARGAGPKLVWIPALALAAYIVGLSYLARGESTGGVLSRWPLGLLFVPTLLAIALKPPMLSATGIVLIVQIAWTVWCVWPRALRTFGFIPRGVAGLLAGIVFVDWLAVSGTGHAVVFALLFVSALLSQRIASAT
jgi:4-hydroxybenzoate polyprenyltransferase